MKKLEALNLIDIVLFSMTIVTFIIGIDQVMRYKTYKEGLENTYWIFSISFILIMLYNLRKQFRKSSSNVELNPSKNTPIVKSVSLKKPTAKTAKKK